MKLPSGWIFRLKSNRKGTAVTVYEDELILCKDCKHYEWMSNRVPKEQAWVCHNWNAETGKNDYCSYAERRTDEQIRESGL